ncbi:MAG: hypothetical protein J6W50_02970 [Bacteroidaceae bacterium]|nr:hypothetical protein [Bacteroidaceae bacterium]
MSVHLIYKRSDGAKMMRPVTTEQEYRALRGSDEQCRLVALARSGQLACNDKGVMVPAKTLLVQFCYSCLPNEDGSLRGSKRLADTVGMDIDLERLEGETDVQYQARLEQIPQRVLALKDELGLRALERSATKGFHMVFGRRPELSQEQNLRWASQRIGVPFDENAKDITRVFFTTTDSTDDLLYLDPQIFEVKEMTVSQADESTAQPDEPPLSTLHSPLKELDPKLVVKALEEQLGGAPRHGARNNFIFAMACHLAHLYGPNPATIAYLVPTYGERMERWRSTIESACRTPKSDKTPEVLLRAIEVAEARAASQPSSMTRDNYQATMPQWPKRVPPLIALLTSKVPHLYKPAVACSAFPALGAHLGDVRFCYIDNVEHAPTFMNTLLARLSIGKSCINKPVEFILADIIERDEENRRREQEWKNALNSKGANKEKPQRPDDLCIQVLVPDMTNAAFVQRLKDAGGKFLYSQMDELDLLDQLKTSTRGKQVSQIIRLAFDCGDYGQERVGSQSVTARVKVKWNWNASSTIAKGQKYFANSLADGTLSRLSFCTILQDEEGAMPIIGTYDQAFADALRPYIEALNSTHGLVECEEAKKLLRTLVKETAQLSVLGDDEAYRILSYRALVIAYLKAMTLYVAHGCRWSREIATFTRWSLEYDLWCKMRFFGQQMQQQLDMENSVRSRGPRNMLELLPTRFSIEQVQAVRREQGKQADCRQMINNWTYRRYIRYDSESGMYEKVG